MVKVNWQAVRIHSAKCDKMRASCHTLRLSQGENTVDRRKPSGAYQCEGKHTLTYPGRSSG